jgi:hypothetical protein
MGNARPNNEIGCVLKAAVCAADYPLRKIKERSKKCTSVSGLL